MAKVTSCNFGREALRGHVASAGVLLERRPETARWGSFSSLLEDKKLHGGAPGGPAQMLDMSEAISESSSLGDLPTETSMLPSPLTESWEIMSLWLSVVKFWGGLFHSKDCLEAVLHIDWLNWIKMKVFREIRYALLSASSWYYYCCFHCYSYWLAIIIM